MRLLQQVFQRCENIGLYQDENENYYLKGDTIMLNEADNHFWENVKDIFGSGISRLQVARECCVPTLKSYVPSEMFEMAMAG